MSGPLAIVLAAGKGTRMKSELPKVLIPALGRPLVEYVLDALDAAGIAQQVVVVGYRQDLVRQALAKRPHVRFAEQTEQKGTGHAVAMCREYLAAHDGPVLVLTGDSPLVQPATLRKLLAEYSQGNPACVLGTAHQPNPTGLGRIVRDAAGNFRAIVEEKDATDEQRRITEVNMSYYVFRAADLLRALDGLRADNRQQEYYLTDAPGILLAQGREVRALPCLAACESLSVNTMDELQIVERALQELPG